jgi:hypothetical protein
LIANGVTVARRSEVDDAFLLNRLDGIADDTRLVERFSEIADVVADYAAAGVGERNDAGGKILLPDKRIAGDAPSRPGQNTARACE